jgi:hypothetical protein
MSETEDILWGAAEIAAAIKRTVRQTNWLLERGQLPAKKVGNRWVASRKALRQALVGV